ncbi:replication initiator [Nocardia sp. CA-119907]|uniref:replication initiator n=1 Tax=Nocardia sp. CA-119907 TaxID=3239973 RepID=UPI003D958C5B
MTDDVVTEQDSPVTKLSLAGLAFHATAEDRAAAPDWLAMAEAAADKWGSCRRPVPMWVVNQQTGDRRAVGAACGNTLESVCPACAKRKRAIRVGQIREGWHLDHEPVREKDPVTKEQIALVDARSRMFMDYQVAKEDNDQELMDGIRGIVEELDKELRETGARKKFPPLEQMPKKRRKRSTRRRDDMPDLPRLKLTNRTIDEAVLGKYRFSMFVTLTLPSYGRIHTDGAVNKKGEVCGDGSPVDPDSYDYVQAARDIVHFTGLVNRFFQELRRVLGYKIQYFGVVEPQKRGAPHLHVLLRTRVSRSILRQVTVAMYKNIWWPHFGEEFERYSEGRMPVWDFKAGTFVDPDTKVPLIGFDEAQDVMDSCDGREPAHVIRFGTHMPRRSMKGIMKDSPEADAAIGYIAKYLTKSTAEILEPPNKRTAAHYNRLHAELQRTPCSENCPVWLRYGIVPSGATEKTIPGRCRGKAHKREHLGVPGNKYIVSTLWTGKTQEDHANERREHVKQLLAGVGMEQRWDAEDVKVTPAKPGDPNVPTRAAMVMQLMAQRMQQRAQYQQAQMLSAAGPPGDENLKQLPAAA